MGHGGRRRAPTSTGPDASTSVTRAHLQRQRRRRLGSRALPARRDHLVEVHLGDRRRRCSRRSTCARSNREARHATWRSGSPAAPHGAHAAVLDLGQELPGERAVQSPAAPPRYVHHAQDRGRWLRSTSAARRQARAGGTAMATAIEVAIVHGEETVGRPDSRQGHRDRADSARAHDPGVRVPGSIPERAGIQHQPRARSRRRARAPRSPRRSTLEGGVLVRIAPHQVHSVRSIVAWSRTLR